MPPSHLSLDFTDASFTHLIVKKDWCSTSEYIFFMTDRSVSWSCKCQSTVATSFMKTEYIDQYNVTWESVWIQSFLEELDYWDLIKKLLIIKADNMTAKFLSWDSTIHSQVKHMNVVYHWQQQQIEQNLLQFKYISFNENAADNLTKLLVTQLYRIFKDFIHMNEI